MRHKWRPALWMVVFGVLLAVALHDDGVLDVFNGLLLVANLDALFDRGHICSYFQSVIDGFPTLSAEPRREIADDKPDDGTFGGKPER